MRPPRIATLCAIAAALSIPLPAPGQQPHHASTSTQSSDDSATQSIDFTLDHPGAPIPHFMLTLQQNGQGQYRGEQLQPSPDAPPTPQPFDTAFTITPAATKKIFALASRLNQANPPCASPAKNIASTGVKTLRYIAPNTAPTSCTYDYTENKDLQAVTNLLRAIATTMDHGRRLDFLHRYDRLGLDEAITTLAAEASADQALELTTIAPTLQSIANDPEVLHRVRTRAAALLSTIPPTPPSQ